MDAGAAHFQEVTVRLAEMMKQVDVEDPHLEKDNRRLLMELQIWLDVHHQVIKAACCAHINCQ